MKSQILFATADSEYPADRIAGHMDTDERGNFKRDQF
jgi:hypothetical protein